MRLSARHQRVLEVLRQAETPLGAYALLDKLRSEGFKTPVQMYRILAKLAQQGLVHRLETLNAYTPCADEGSAGFRLFAICDNCGHVDELIDTDLGKKLGRCTKTQAFQLDSKAVEVRGLCAVCVDLLRRAGRRAAIGSVTSRVQPSYEA